MFSVDRTKEVGSNGMMCPIGEPYVRTCSSKNVELALCVEKRKTSKYLRARRKGMSNHCPNFCTTQSGYSYFLRDNWFFYNISKFQETGILREKKKCFLVIPQSHLLELLFCNLNQTIRRWLRCWLLNLVYNITKLHDSQSVKALLGT